MEILGTRVDNLDRSSILQKIEGFLDEPKFHQIVTVNPEFILEAKKNAGFQEVLNSADLNIADGFGVSCAFFYNLQKLKCRLTGADLLKEILKIAEKKGLSVFLACRKDGLSSFEEIRMILAKKYPRLKVNGRDIDLFEVSPRINRGETSIDSTILISNFGAPSQEFFIRSQKDGKIRLGIGVGGALDFMSGKLPRAPILFQKIGLEWLWRFLKEPKYRAKRIFRAVIIFPIRVILNK